MIETPEKLQLRWENLKPLTFSKHITSFKSKLVLDYLAENISQARFAYGIFQDSESYSKV